MKILLLISLFSITLTLPCVEATTFSRGAERLRDSNVDAALAMNYGLLSLLYDSSFITYYSYLYMNSAAGSALNAYQNVSSAQSATPSSNGSLALSNTYNDWYYKYLSSFYLYYTYVYPSFYLSSEAITNGYLALFYTSYSTFYTGLASNGGTR